jgi:hypothetical protein
MIPLDRAFLAEMGLNGLPSNLAGSTLSAVYAALEHTVGFRLASQMTDLQLDEFEAFIDANDEDGALRWLEYHFPDYRVFVQKEFEGVRSRLATAGPWIAAVTITSG